MSESENRPVNLPERQSIDPMLESGLDPYPLEPSPPPAAQEPLFNKKVMLLWAMAALIFGVGGTVLLRTVKATAREAIIQAVKEGEQKSGGRVKVQRNRGVITITTETPPAGTAAQPAPAPTGSAQPKEAPAPAPVPAPARK